MTMAIQDFRANYGVSPVSPAAFKLQNDSIFETKERNPYFECDYDFDRDYDKDCDKDYDKDCDYDADYDYDYDRDCDCDYDCDYDA